MAEQVFPVLPKIRRRMVLSLVLRLLALGMSVWVALDSGLWLWWAAALLMVGLTLFTGITLAQRKFIAKVDDTGVTVQLAAGKEMHAPWNTIEAHTIDPARAIGAVLQKAEGGRVRVLPVSIRAMGSEAAEELLAAMKARLPKLEYRAPSLAKPKN